MLVKDKAIVINKINLANKKCIVKLISLNHGMLDCLCFASNSPKSKVKISSLLPLSIINVELVIKQNKELHQLNETHLSFVFDNISYSLTKLSLIQIISEIISKTAKEQHGNSHMFNFLNECILNINNEKEENLLNFVCFFLIELTKYLGIEPQNNFNNDNKFFDCRAGEFTPYALVLPLGFDYEQSKALSNLLSQNNYNIKLNNSLKQNLIDGLLAYYAFHIPNFGYLKSLSVLRELQ
ncbi:MAG: DNA repair protein RecO [Bacteroidetes bacterium]|nr:DNA repair protein RecO [Bacteroidota bacterium]